MYGYDLDMDNLAIQPNNNLMIYTLIAFIIALATTIVIYCVFMNEDNKKKLDGFVKDLYEFLHFKKLVFDKFLKIAYLFTSLFITIMSFRYIGYSFVIFLLYLIGGNIVTRIVFEACMMFYKTFVNVNEINKKTK